MLITKHTPSIIISIIKVAVLFLHNPIIILGKSRFMNTALKFFYSSYT